MLRLSRRLDALEGVGAISFHPWHVVFAEDWQSEDQAVAAYEVTHGSIADASAWVVRFTGELVETGT